MMTKLFWIFAGLDLAILLAMFVMHVTEAGGRGNSSGGYEMALIFWIIAPAIFLGLSILLFLFSTSNFAKITAILMATLPWIALVGIRGNIRTPDLDRQFQ